MLEAVLLAHLLLPLSDRVTLRDGTEIEGTVLFEDDQTVVVRVRKKERTIPRDQVDTIHSRTRSLAVYLDRREEVDAADADALADLARFCASEGLADEAQLAWWQVLTASPAHAEAYESLGGKTRSGQLVLPLGRKWLAFADLREKRAEWKDAWELRTTHYLLRTNLDLPKALDLAVDLERFYRDFFDIYARPGGVYEVEEVMEVNAHADAGSFLPGPSRRDARFEPIARALELNASRGIDQQLFVHEATKQLVHAISMRGESGFSRFPAWVDEGLASYVKSGASGGPGKLRLVEGDAALTSLFAKHAGEKSPLSLKQVLRLAWSDFQKNDSSLEFAQAYTLVHFLMRGEDGRFRDGFDTYLQSAYNGQGATTHLMKNLGVDHEDLEVAWHAYAKKVARGK